MFNFLKRKIETVTLKKYDLVFKTIDGKIHINHNIEYINEDAITCSALEYYLIGKEFLKDDKNVYYPIKNIISIDFVLVETIEDVKKVYGDFIMKVYYSKDMIKIVDR